MGEAAQRLWGHDDWEWSADSIVLAEFHEQRGPVALWSLPEDSNSSSNSSGERTMPAAELGTLLASVLSVDYRQSLPALAAFGTATVVFAEAPAAGAAHLAVHFTLLDVAARGFVRPLALVYITRDAARLAAHSRAVARELTAAAALLQRANIAACRADACRRAADLRHTRALLAAGDAAALAAAFAPTGGRPHFTADGLAACLADLAALRRGLARLHGVPPLAKVASQQQQQTHEEEKQKTLKTETETEQQQQQKQGQEEEEEKEEEEGQVQQQLCHQVKQGAGNVRREEEEEKEEEEEESGELEGYEPQVVLAIYKSSFDKALRRVETLCGGAAVAQARAWLGAVLARRACALPLAVLRESAARALGGPRATRLCVGDAVCVDFALDIAARAPVPPGVLRRTRPCGTARGSPFLAASSPLSRRSSGRSSGGSTPLGSPVVAVGAITRSDTTQSLPDMLACGGDSDSNSGVESPQSPQSVQSSADSSAAVSWSEKVSAFLEQQQQQQQRVLTAQEMDRVVASLGAAVPDSGDDGEQQQQQQQGQEQCCSSVGDGTEDDQAFRAANNLWCRSVAAATSSSSSSGGEDGGHAATATVTLRQFLRESSFAEHLLYSLLRGRPVVVLGPGAAGVRAAVRLLAPFVAGDARTAVCEARTAPLRLADLAALRLVGLATRRATLLPEHLAPYLTVLSVSERGAPVALVAPPYPAAAAAAAAATAVSRNSSSSGGGGGAPPQSIVAELLARPLTWLDDASFASHCHEVLFRVAVRALLYYHMCAAGLAHRVPFRAAPYLRFPDGSLDRRAQTQPAVLATHCQQQQQQQQQQDVSSPSSLWRRWFARRTEPAAAPVPRRHASPAPPPVLDLSTSPPLLPPEGEQEEQQQQQQQQEEVVVVTAPRTLREHLVCAMRCAEARAEPAYPTAPVAAAAREAACAAFFAHAGTACGDREIVQYLAEVVKTQQVLAAGAPGTRVPPLRLDTRPCHAFVEHARPTTAAAHAPLRPRSK